MKRILRVLTRCLVLVTAVVGFSPCYAPPALNGGPMNGGAMNPFNISEDDLNQIVEALNELTPDQLKELEELGRATEDRMRSQNLDPNNPDDWMKFMENEGMMPPQPPQRPTPPQRPPKKPRKQAPMRPSRPQSFTKPKEPVIPTPIPVTSQADTKVMIADLLSRLASLKQKAVTRPHIEKQLGTIRDQLDKLALYLNIVAAPDMVTLLSSKEFEGLHHTLDQLHKNMITLEPRISARERSPVINVDDPYEVLDLPYSATAEEIEERFTDLASERSPEAIQAQLTAEGCDAVVCKRIIKAAQRTFRLIERSYSQLKDPALRAEIDARLSDKIAQETAKDQQSHRAFDQLFGALNQAVMGGSVVAHLEQLLEKYKPQELEQAQRQQQREKEAYERSKRRIIVPQIPPGRIAGRQKSGPYDQFYRKMGQNRFGRPGGQRQPMRPGRPSLPPRKQAPKKPGAPEEKGKGGGAGKSSGPGKKEAASKGKGQKKAKKKETKKPSAPKPVLVEISEKDRAALGKMDTLSKALENAKNWKGVLKVASPLRSPNGKEMVDEYKLTDVMYAVKNQLTSRDNPAEEAPAKLQAIYEKYKMADIKNTLMSLAPTKEQKLSKIVKDQWKETGAKYGTLIDEWYTQIYKQLDPGELYAAGNPIKSLQKATHYNLQPDLAKVDPWKAKADKEKDKEPAPRPKAPSEIDLGTIRDTVYSIKTYYDAINDAVKQ